jgi:PAS domain S-box-containing protein
MESMSGAKMKPSAAGGLDCMTVLPRILDLIQEGLVVCDCDHSILWANRWIGECYADKAPLVGKKCFEVFGDAAAFCLDCPHLADPGQGGAATHSFACLSPEGQTRWLELHTYQLEDAEGRVAGTVGHFKDVTDQRRTEEMLRDEISRRTLRVGQSSDGIVVLDEEGGVVETNLQFAHMLGYPLEEMSSLHVWDWERQFTKEETLEMVKAVNEEGAHFESRHLRKDGSFYDVAISSNGALYGGKKYIFCVCRDITERKRSERERESLIQDLQAALAEVKAQKGILPLCSYCKNIRVDDERWEQVDVYIQAHSEADVSHGICPECMKERYPGL